MKTTATRFQVGNIVVVTCEDCIHYEKQGLIVHVEPKDVEHPLRIWFGKESDYRDNRHLHGVVIGDGITQPQGEEWRSDSRVWEYCPEEVELTEGWSVVTLASRHFKDFHHTIYQIPKDATYIGGKCWCKGCSQTATRLILFNMWGSVYPGYACDECSGKYHLKCGDSVPFEIPAAPR